MATDTGRLDNAAQVIDRFLAGRAWPALVAAIFTLQAVLVLGHEPWLDEWQALQISLQSPDLAALLENLRYEGHPPLWYLILRGLASVLPPAWVLPAAALPIALAIQAMILFRLPLSRLERLLLAASFYVLIDYGAISRSLGLGVLLILIAWIWRDRRGAWLAIALLPMADFLFGVLSGVMLVLQWRERRLCWPGVVLWLLVSIAAAWTVRPATDMIPAFWLNGPVHDGLVQLGRLGTVLVPLQMDGAKLVWNNSLPIAIGLPAGLGFLFLGRVLLRGDGFATLLFFGFVAFTLVFSISVYPLAIRHQSLAALLLVLLVSRRREAGARPNPIFPIWLAVMAGCGIAAAAVNLARPFDTAGTTARYIESHGLANRHWVTFPDSRAQGVSALLGIEFERGERGCMQSFIRWNFRSRIKTLANFEDEMGVIAQRRGGFHLLTDFRIDAKRLRNPADYRLLTHIPAGYDGQDFYLYQVRPDLPERTEHMPHCAPPRLPLRVMPPKG